MSKETYIAWQSAYASMEDQAEAVSAIVVRELCAGKKLTFTHNSDATLKGFDEPVALFEVDG